MRRLAIPNIVVLQGIAKWAILTILLAGFVAVCPAGAKSRVSSLKIIQLAEPSLTGSLSLEEALARRRSVRRFNNQPLDLTQIGQLAWAGQGITEKQRGFRTAPSAGAIYPIKLYFATQEGLFVYKTGEHSLEQTSSQDIRKRLAVAALRQRAVAEAACDIIVTGSVRKLADKYADKARRFMLMEAGHIAQNILLQSVSLDLACVPVGAFDINRVRKLCRLPMTLEPIYIICVGHPAVEGNKEQTQVRQGGGTRVKRAALIVASKNFRDEELFETNRIISQAGVKTVVVSTKKGVITGMLGGRAQATILVNELNVDDYDAIIFVGGSGAKQYFSSRAAADIARQAAEKQKVLAAICIAPSILANAGLLNGRKATSFPSERTTLQKAGAIYTGTAVERDGLIITASGPRASIQFGKALADAIAGK